MTAVLAVQGNKIADSHGLRPRNDRKKKAEATTDKYEMRKAGCAGAVSNIENLGYDEQTLESLRKAGWSMYKNGVCVMKGARKKA